jgi:alanyl-tRNA synthetase
MTAPELKKLFVDFFVSKGHVEIPSSSLIPENDPTTLFISAGMHPLVPYLLGQPHPLGKRLVNVQKCVRTGDIDEVGDEFHHTFFEMLGNWSLGDYFKKDAITWSFELISQVLKLDLNKFSVTCFAGDDDAPRDDESAEIWKGLGIAENKIEFLPKKNNWWGPASVTGPCGPDTEMFYSGVEIWNDVFMQYFKNADSSYSENQQINVDTGMGVERTVALANGFTDNYLSDIWQPIIKKIEDISGKKYQDNLSAFRIIADHLRAAVFIIAAGVEPNNKEAGYVLRRLIRRSIRQGKLIGIETNFLSVVATVILNNQSNYAGVYPELDQNREKILSILDMEENKFRQTLNKGLSQIQKLIDRQLSVSGKEAFDLYQSFGFPVELVEEELAKNNLSLNIDEFNKFKDEHIKQSQTLSAGKFKSGLADNSEIITRYHTTTHLLHAALRKVLGNHVAQSGSNITSERLRFDFSHPNKLTDDELKQVEDLVNQVIGESREVTVESMKFSEAVSSGALAFFGNKYPEVVTVYTVSDFSREVCTGPHVDNTSKLGKFVIQKEESAGSGKRRIYAILN